MPVVIVLIAILVMAGTIRLGIWQTHRAEEKIAVQQHLLSAESGVALPIEGQAPDPLQLVWHRVAITGNWLGDDVVYLDNRPMDDGRVGFYVIMPLKLASGVVVLVNRGWLPRDASQRTRIAPFETPSGPVDVEGVALPDEAHFLDLGNATPAVRTIWENFNFDNYLRASGLSPLHLVVRQDNRTLDGLARDWPDRGAVLQGEINTHYGYTFQWYAMAFAVFALLVYYGFKQGAKRGA